MYDWTLQKTLYALYCMYPGLIQRLEILLLTLWPWNKPEYFMGKQNSNKELSVFWTVHEDELLQFVVLMFAYVSLWRSIIAHTQDP